MIEFDRGGWTHADISADDEFRYPVMVTAKGQVREMIVTRISVALDRDGEFNHAWLVGDLVLLSGNRSVQSGEASARIESYDQLPEQVRNALEERKARGR